MPSAVSPPVSPTHERQAETSQTKQVKSVNALIDQAFERLAGRSGFQARSDQRQIALLLADMIQDGANALIEAPTGLGKSLATLIQNVCRLARSTPGDTEFSHGEQPFKIADASRRLDLHV